MDPENRSLWHETGEDDRLKVTEFTALEKLSLIIAADHKYPYEDFFEDRHEDIQIEDHMIFDFEQRVVVRVPGTHEEVICLLEDTREFFQKLEESRPGWKAPELELARVVDRLRHDWTISKKLRQLLGGQPNFEIPGKVPGWWGVVTQRS